MLDSMCANLFDSEEYTYRLFVSPKFPPTPVQKKISPHEWLSEGHNRQGKSTDDIPTLDDVRKNLMCSIDEAENLSDMMASYNSATS